MIRYEKINNIARCFDSEDHTKEVVWEMTLEDEQDVKCIFDGRTEEQIIEDYVRRIYEVKYGKTK